MKTTPSSHDFESEHALEFVIGADQTYIDATVVDPSLLLLDVDVFIGQPYRAHLPEKYKKILETHYTQLIATGQTQVYRYEITDTEGCIRQLLGLMDYRDDKSIMIRVYDLTRTPDYRIIDNLDFYQQSLQQIKSAVEKSAHIREAMSEILGVIARFCHGDRVFFSHFSEDGSRVESIEEFDPRDGDSDKMLYMGIETSQFPWLMNQLYEGKAVKIPNVQDLPTEAATLQTILTAGGTLADLVVPIFIGQDLIGLIGCDSITNHVHWTDTHVRFLQEVGDYLLGRAHMRQIKNELFAKNVEFSTLLKHLPHPIFQISESGRLLYSNNAFRAFFKTFFPDMAVDAQVGMDCKVLSDALQFQTCYRNQIQKKQVLESPLYLNREYKINNETVHFQIQMVPIHARVGANSYLAIFTDLTELLDSQQELGLMQERLKSAIQANHSLVYEWDVVKDQITSSGSLDATESHLKTNFDELTSWIHPGDQERFRASILHFIRGGTPTLQVDFRILKSGTDYRWVSNYGRTIDRNAEGKTTRFVGTITDISARKKYETDLEYLASHDLLTRLKNRNAFESYTHNNALNHQLLIVADMDGLKPMNDFHGHQFGDRALKRIATILTQHFQDAHIVSRIGGDEFAIIMPPLRRDEISLRVEEVKAAIQQQTDLPMETNLSIGYAYGHDDEDFETMFRRAEDRMYKDKLTNRTSSKASVVLSLMKSLQEKNLETDEHCHRVEEYCIAIARHMHLEVHIINELKLLAKLHDIGKIAIPIQILNKPGPLSDEEWLMMKQHAEIGARIVSASPNMDSISQGILAHHEHWNGCGYPEGKKETEIPLTARILSVVDAYDAMTSQRCYNTIKSKDQAMDELLVCSGKQFDPFITKLFVSILQTE